MPSEGESVIRTTLEHCIVTPFKNLDEGFSASDKQRYTKIYCEGSDFALDQIRGGDQNAQDNFY